MKRLLTSTLATLTACTLGLTAARADLAGPVATTTAPVVSNLLLTGLTK
jgi:hypothetical protein